MEGSLVEVTKGANLSNQFEGNNADWNSISREMQVVQSEVNSSIELTQFLDAAKPIKNGVYQLTETQQKIFRYENDSELSEFVKTAEVPVVSEECFQYIKRDYSLVTYNFDDRTTAILITVQERKGWGILTKAEIKSHPMELDMPELREVDVEFELNKPKDGNKKLSEEQCVTKYYLVKGIPTARRKEWLAKSLAKANKRGYIQ